MHVRHPDLATLREFARAGLPETEAAVIRRHIDDCEVCFGEVMVQGASIPASDGLFGVSYSEPPDFESAPLTDLGQRFGPYVTTRILGEGGMGVVFEAVHSQTGRSAAVKTIRRSAAALFAAFRNEVTRLSQIHHPGIVRIIDSDIEDVTPWYAMELLAGKTLATRNAERWVGASGTGVPISTAAYERAEPLPFHDVVSAYQRLCEPLSHVHQRGLVHCDLKPANVFLRDGGQPVLADFGLVSRFGTTESREGLVIAARGRGTLPYVSPEVILGRVPDMRADIYAFGCMLYESLTGHPPHVGATRAEIIHKHLSADVTPASRRARDVPAAMDQLLERLLTRNPAHRVRDADEVRRELARWGEALELRHRSTPPMPRPSIVGRDAELVRAMQFVEALKRG
jgi:eukaryotic-like serine/threonine-protein kinase